MNTQFEKTYVGKGKKSQPWATRITLNVDELLKHAYEFEGMRLVTIEIAEMKQPDNFGRTHAAYISSRVAEEVQPDDNKDLPDFQAPAIPKPKRNKKK